MRRLLDSIVVFLFSLFYRGDDFDGTVFEDWRADVTTDDA